MNRTGDSSSKPVTSQPIEATRTHVQSEVRKDVRENAQEALQVLPHTDSPGEKSVEGVWRTLAEPLAKGQNLPIPQQTDVQQPSQQSIVVEPTSVPHVPVQQSVIAGNEPVTHVPVQSSVVGSNEPVPHVPVQQSVIAGNEPVTHVQAQQSVIAGNEPVTHVQAQQTPISQPTKPFDRFPRIQLELNTVFNITQVEIKSAITYGLNNPNFGLLHPLLNFLAWWYEIPGGYTQVQYAQISLERILLLYDNKDDIINECKKPGFLPQNMVQYISHRTGLMFDVHADPKETIRLIEDVLRVAEKVFLEKVSDNDQDKDNVRKFLDAKMQTLNCFPIKDQKLYDQFKALREPIFEKYASEHAGKQKTIMGEMGLVVTHLDVPQGSQFNPIIFDQELLAYKGKAPMSGTARETEMKEVNYAKYMSANSFRKYLLDKYKDSEAEIDEYLNDAINNCLLGCYLPVCDDNIDSDEKILAEEFKACRLNMQPQNGHYTTANAFKNYLNKEHSTTLMGFSVPILHSYSVDVFLQKKIQEGLIASYVPTYKKDGTADIQEILNEELNAFKLNRGQAIINIDKEKIDLEKYLKEERKIFDVKGTAQGQSRNINEADLRAALHKYLQDRTKLYIPDSFHKPYISKILDDEIAAYKLNKRSNANKADAKRYLKDERNILSMEAKKDIDAKAAKITEADLDAALQKHFPT